MKCLLPLSWKSSFLLAGWMPQTVCGRLLKDDACDQVSKLQTLGLCLSWGVSHQSQAAAVDFWQHKTSPSSRTWDLSRLKTLRSNSLFNAVHRPPVRNIIQIASLEELIRPAYDSINKSLMFGEIQGSVNGSRSQSSCESWFIDWFLVHHLQNLKLEKSLLRPARCDGK